MKNVFCLSDFGAVGDGVTLDTAALQRAIDACAEVGGTVVVPAGTYRCGTIRLRSHVTLYLEHGAEIVESTDRADFETGFPGFYTSISYSAFLFADGIEDAAIRGFGTIRGVPGGPILYAIENSSTILLEDILFTESPNWNGFCYATSDIRVIRVRVTHSEKDGLNFVCCRNVLIDGAYLEDVGDDSICFKNESVGQCYETRPACGFLTENVVIANTTVVRCRRNHPAVKIGTGTAGIFRNFLIHDCIFTGMDAAFTIQLLRPDMKEVPERVIENIVLSDLIVRDCHYLIDITEMDVHHPVIRNITCRSVQADGIRAASRIVAAPDAPVENVVFENLMLGRQALPADAPFFRMENVHGITAAAWTSEEDCVLLSLTDCRRARVSDLTASGAKPRLVLAGRATDGIRYRSGDESAPQPVEVGTDVPHGALRPRIASVCAKAEVLSATVPAGQAIKGVLCLSHTGEEGFLREPILEDGVPVGEVRTWLYRDEERETRFRTEPLYHAGRKELQIASLTLPVTVTPTPARIEYDSRFEITREADTLSFCVRAKNAGGTAGTTDLSLLGDGTVLDTAAVPLAPGEETRLTLQAPVGCAEYELPGVGRWTYTLIARASVVRAEKDGRRITLVASGRQCSDTGDYEKLHLTEYAAVSQRVTGDFTATVHLLSQEASGQYASAGFVISPDIAEAAKTPYRLVFSNFPKYGSMGLWRADTDGDGATEEMDYCTTWYGCYMRVERRGSRFRAWISGDGVTWEERRTFDLPHAAAEQDVALHCYANSVTDGTCEVVYEDFTVTQP